MTDSSTDSLRQTEIVEEAFELVHRLWSGQLLYSAVELGLVERLSDGLCSAEDAAIDLRLDAEKTYRLLRGLTYYDVVEESAGQRFRLTPIGECFLADHPHSIRADLRFLHSPEFVSAMFHLPDIVREGEPDGFRREFGSGLYEYGEERPAFGSTVNEFMTARVRRETDEVLDTLDSAGIAECSHVCDVGGGQGHLLTRLLERHAHLKGTVFDLPEVLKDLDPRAAVNNGVGDRFGWVAGDMFEGVPSTDGYVLKEILHNWDDEECVEILSNLYEAAPPDGRVFVVEALVPGPERDHFAKRLDLTMMVHLGGRERTEREYEALLNRSGWNPVETREAPSERFGVVEARKE